MNKHKTYNKLTDPNGLHGAQLQIRMCSLNNIFIAKSDVFCWLCSKSLNKVISPSPAPFHILQLGIHIAIKKKCISNN